MKWKDLTKEEKKHLKEQEITTLRDFKKTAKSQAEMRREKIYGFTCEPCWNCKMIARKLGLEV